MPLIWSQQYALVQGGTVPHQRGGVLWGWVIRIIFDPTTRQGRGGGGYGVGDPWITCGSFLDHFRPFCSLYFQPLNRLGYSTVSASTEALVTTTQEQSKHSTCKNSVPMVWWTCA